jgi:hypothetical protein
MPQRRSPGRRTRSKSRSRGRGKRTRQPPFELRKGPTGGYTIHTVESALELQRQNPAAWRRLPRQLRREAAEREKLLDEALARQSQIPGSAVREFDKLNPGFLAHIRQTDLKDTLSLPDAFAIQDSFTSPTDGRPAKQERLAYIQKGRAEGKSLARIARELGLPYNVVRAAVRPRQPEK